MAFWHKINQSKLRLLSHQFKRCYVQVPYAHSHNYTVKSSKTSVAENLFWGTHRRPTDFCNNVRFYAVPEKYKPKEEKESNERRINDRIIAQFVRLVTDEGHNVVSLHEALEQARQLKLDLVEVSKNADPPVCKIMDFHRERYKQELKEKDRAKSKEGLELRKGEPKEVRFAGKTEQKDLKIKADSIKKLMDRGYRVKCIARGNSKDDDPAAILSRLTPLIEDVCVVESGPLVDKRQAIVILRHVKFGAPKKGPKKLSDVEMVMTAKPSDEDGLPDKNIGTDKTASDAAKENDTNHAREINTAPEADFRSNFNVPSFSHATPTQNSRIPDRLSSSLPEPALGTENRYQKREPKIGTKESVDDRGPDKRYLVRSEPQFSNQRRHPQSEVNVTPPMEKRKPLGIDSSPDAPSTRANSYGLFSSPKASPLGKQGVAAEVKNEGNRYASASISNTGSSKSNEAQRTGLDRGGQGEFGIFSRNIPNGNSNGRQRPGVDRGGESGFGIFSGESPNVSANRIYKSN